MFFKLKARLMVYQGGQIRKSIYRLEEVFQFIFDGIF